MVLNSSKVDFTVLPEAFWFLKLFLRFFSGSQARFLQADAPSQLEHYKAAALVYLTEVKDQAQKALDSLDGTEYQQYK